MSIAGKNINNLRYADETTLMAESKEELKSLLMKEGSEKVGLKLNIQKTKVVTSSPNTSWQTDEETVERLRDIIFSGSKITADGDCRHEIKRCWFLGRKAMTNLVQFSSSVMSDIFQPHGLQLQGFWVHHQLPKLTQTHVHQISDAIHHLILCLPLLLLPSIFPSIRVFSNESDICIRWPKYWSFSFNISPSNEHPGLLSFRRDWLDLLAVQGTLQSLLQHHSLKTSILWYSAFFMVQLSPPYMTDGKTIALSRWTFVGKIMSLLFNALYRG